MISIVGCTGFVGSNLCLRTHFDGMYNTRNIQDAFGSRPEILVYAGLRAEKYLANIQPENDLKSIYQAQRNIELINPNNVILISTIDVLGRYDHVSETTKIDRDQLEAYGYNRLLMEEWVKTNYPDSLIVRLPALFGYNIKKNFLYDMIHIIPSKITRSKMEELSSQDKNILPYYDLAENGFYKVKNLDKETKELLKIKFLTLGFSALNFTDSRNVYQFYPLERLWNDILIAYDNRLDTVHMATEPVSAEEVYSFVFDKEFKNEILDVPLKYDFITEHGNLYNRCENYILNRKDVLEKIKLFIDIMKNQENH